MKYYETFCIDRFSINIIECDGFITDVYATGDDPTEVSDGIRTETSVITRMKEELLRYFEGSSEPFSTPLYLRGTGFQRRVYHALLEVPFGKVASYRQIAERVGSPRAFRAVGQAVHHNPHLIVVPCHRIIGSDGSLTGFYGGIEMKQALLEHEGVLLGPSFPGSPAR